MAQIQAQTDNANQVKQATPKEGSRHKPQMPLNQKIRQRTNY